MHGALPQPASQCRLNSTGVAWIAPGMQEYLDRHESHVPQAPSKRPFLCVLLPDTLQLASRPRAVAACRLAPAASLPQSEAAVLAGCRTLGVD